MGKSSRLRLVKRLLLRFGKVLAKLLEGLTLLEQHRQRYALQWVAEHSEGYGLSLRCKVCMNSSQSFFSSVVRPSLTLAKSLMSSLLAWFAVGTVLPTQGDW
jgi:hypothetical protein